MPRPTAGLHRYSTTTAMERGLPWQSLSLAATYLVHIPTYPGTVSIIRTIVSTTETLKGQCLGWCFNKYELELVIKVLFRGWIPARRHMWVQFVLAPALLQVFFSGSYGFPPSTKTKFQFDQDIELAWKPAKADLASSVNIVIYYLAMRPKNFLKPVLNVFYSPRLPER